MAHCDESIELISAALDGALSPEEQARLEAHLAQCPDCKALYEDLSMIHQSLLDLPPVEVPEGLTGRIMDAVAAEAARPKVVPLPQPKRSARPWQRWAVTAAAVAVVILGARTMQTNKSADESIIAPAQALPSPLASAESGLRTYSGENTVPEPDAAGLDSTEAANDIFSVQAQSAETAQTSQEPTVTTVPDRVKYTSGDTPAPEPSAVPKEIPQSSAAPEAPVSSGAVAPRMAMNMVPSPIPADPSETGSGEETDIPSQEEPISPNVFVVQTAGAEEPPLLPEGMDSEAGETAVPNDALLTSIGNESISEDDEPEETLPLTPYEAIALVVARCFGDSGYEMVREDPEEGSISCHVSLMDGETVITGGTVVYTGETEECFLFECHWDDDPENPYHYSVHKTEGYVAWQGEVLGNEP